MADKKKASKKGEKSPIYIVSGGSGASGEQVVGTVIVQYPEFDLPIEKIPHVRNKKQILQAVKKASANGGIIVHTLVNPDLRNELIKQSRDLNVKSIDLMGPLFTRLNKLIGQKPLGEPGLYRQLHHSYYDRIDAIEYAVTHDDGKNTQDLASADLVIIGVSRSGKTPLSMYLAVLGYKVANIPLVRETPIPKELFEIDCKRVFALDIDHEQLMNFRIKRQERLSLHAESSYTDPKFVFNDLEEARNIYRRHNFTLIEVTNKPIESSAAEIIEFMNLRFNNHK